MKLRFDLHVHTVNSNDAFTKPSELGSLCKLKGLDGIAITDHNQPCLRVPDGTTSIRGIEISSANGHVIGLGLSSPIGKGLSADNTIREIHRLGGLAVIPHPYDRFRSSVNPELLTVRPDAIEVFNASSILHSLAWRKAVDFARKTGLPSVAGSDSHIPQTIGTAYTLIETSSTEPTSVLDSIREGKVTPIGGSIHLSQRLRKLLLQAGRSR